MNYSWEVAKLIIYLALVLGLIYLVAYFVKNRLAVQNNNKHIKVLERLYLNNKINLSLIKAGDKILLISVSSEKVNLLTSWPAEEFAGFEQENGDNINNNTFKDYIQDFMKKGSSLIDRRDNNDEK